MTVMVILGRNQCSGLFFSSIFGSGTKHLIVALRLVPDTGTTVITAIPTPIGITDKKNAKSKGIILAYHLDFFCRD
jgi:hypothetical protein